MKENEIIQKMLLTNNRMALSSAGGIPTLLRAPSYQSPTDLDIALIGVPFDGGTTNRAGARHGPREIRNQSNMLGFQNHYNKITPYTLCRIGDVGDVPLCHQHNLEKSIQEIEAYYHTITKANAIPITAGGDHSISYPILKALGAQQPLALIHIDAHCDTALENGCN
ncbi:arginase family protein, partial [Methylicorpusculum sp.]|uniref:arginase family protein n=1 Tax=Methylicorpusculum sp. TaxID=2713644 RepID=UPI002ABBABC9